MVVLHVKVPEPARRLAKVEAARRGIEMGEFVAAAINAYVRQPEQSEVR